jgi:L-alanine-DL-glutamate epimerase-like enolase superfamily enzyme
MKILRVETITTADYPNMLWLHLHTDDGLVGLGEAYYGPAAVEGYLHETAAPYLLGQDPGPIERHHFMLGRRLQSRLTHRAMGAETRGLAAVDMALWDLFGQRVGRPLYACLGGPVRDRIRLYNTCAGGGYFLRRTAQPGADLRVTWGIDDQPVGYDDLRRWQDLDQAGDLAQELLADGITAMKIWPFDQFVEATLGQHITPAQIEQGLRPFRQIRAAVGMQMEIAVELHALWNLPAAIRIAQALEAIQPMWFEDPIRNDNLEAVAEFARATRVPVTASETLASRWAFRELLAAGAAGIVMFDPGWVGGISEAVKIAHLAEAYHRPFAPHDCNGPVVFAVGAHLCQALPNALIMEGVRAFYLGWYRDVVTDLPTIAHGTIAAPDGPGLGLRLRPEFLAGPSVRVRSSAGAT